MKRVMAAISAGYRPFGLCKPQGDVTETVVMAIQYCITVLYDSPFFSRLKQVGLEVDVSTEQRVGYRSIDSGQCRLPRFPRVFRSPACFVLHLLYGCWESLVWIKFSRQNE